MASICKHMSYGLFFWAVEGLPEETVGLQAAVVNGPREWAAVLPGEPAAAGARYCLEIKRRQRNFRGKEIFFRRAAVLLRRRGGRRIFW